MSFHKQQKAYVYALLSMIAIIVVWFLLVPPSYLSPDKDSTSVEEGAFDTLKSEFSNIF